jgi:hypothetical protein
MRPLTVLLGIVMGSTFSIALGHALTGVVFLLLPEYSHRLAGEMGPLGRTLAGAVLLTAVSATSFYGELRRRSWRGLAHASLVAGLAFVVLRYWP